MQEVRTTEATWRAPSPIGIGHLVRCRRFPWGVAKVVAFDQRDAVIQFWQGPEAATEVVVHRPELEWAGLQAGVRCFVRQEDGS